MRRSLGIGERIIAFIQDPHELNTIMESLGIEKNRSLPPIPDYSSYDESMFSDFANLSPMVCKRRQRLRRTWYLPKDAP